MKSEHPKIIRDRLGWSQQRMAEYLGVNASTVSRLETGVTSVSGPIRRLLDQLEKTDDANDASAA